MHTFFLCKRCLAWSEGPEALGAVLFWIGVGLLFSYFFNWPRFLWSWDPHGSMGPQGGAVVFGTMAAGAALFLAFGSQRWLDGAALDAREVPDEPGWDVWAVIPEAYSEVVRSAITPSRATVPRRDAWDDRSHAPYKADDSPLSGAMKGELAAWLVDEKTLEFERRQNAWWSRNDLLLQLTKNRIHDVNAEELFPAANSAIDALVREGLLQGTDSGYRASATLRTRRRQSTDSSKARRGVCYLCGGDVTEAPAEMVVRTGREVSSRVVDSERVGNTTITRSSVRYDHVEDLVVHLCPKCWGGRRTSARRAIWYGPITLLAMLILSVGSFTRVDTWYIALGSLAVLIPLGFWLLVVLLKRAQESHPVRHIARRVLQDRERCEGLDGLVVVCTTWPKPRRRWGDGWEEAWRPPSA